jgi:hypothetical protein
MKITAEFTTDRKLTPAEVSALLDAIYLQIKEPWDADNEDANYSTKEIRVVVDKPDGEATDCECGYGH